MVGRKDWSISTIRMLAMCSIVACHLCQLYGLPACMGFKYRRSGFSYDIGVALWIAT